MTARGDRCAGRDWAQPGPRYEDRLRGQHWPDLSVAASVDSGKLVARLLPVTTNTDADARCRLVAVCGHSHRTAARPCLAYRELNSAGAGSVGLMLIGSGGSLLKWLLSQFSAAGPLAVQAINEV